MARRPSESLEAARKRVEQAKERAKQAKKSKQKREAKVKNRAKAARQRVRESRPVQAGRAVKEEGQATTAEAKLLASELGVSVSGARKAADRLSDRIDSAAAEGNLESLDLDGDGDTDLLGSLEEELDAGGGPAQSIDPSRPVMDFEGEFDTPVMENTTLDIDPGKPSPGEVTDTEDDMF